MTAKETCECGHPKHISVNGTQSCGICCNEYGLGKRTMDQVCSRYRPAPVEAKEKEPDWDKLNYAAKDHGCPCVNCAEPKPTPSTPTEHKPILLETASAGCTCGWPNDGLPRRWHQVDEHIKKATCTHEWMQPPPRKPYCTLCGTLKPQPDSSSIPEEVAENCNCWHVSKHSGRRFPGDHLPDCPARDSSSISTEPTFEEWKKTYFDSPEFLMTDTCEEVAWAAWNAAKGQSNGQ